MILKTITPEGKQADRQIDKNNNYNISLFQDRGQCEYHNSVAIEKISEGSITPNQIKVSNKLCQQNGQFMQKVTIIKFNDEIITLRDRYRFMSQPQQPVDHNSQKRIHIFKKPLHAESKNEGKRRVTKNLPKNFIKAFLNYLQSVKDEKNSELLDCKMKLFTSRQKYNNSFIQRIVDDPDLDHYFVDFLNNHAKDWIQHSKIRDKQVHLQAIEVFKRLSSTKSDKKVENPNSLQSYLSSFSDESQRLSELSRDQNESDKESIIANQSRDEAEEISQ